MNLRRSNNLCIIAFKKKDQEFSPELVEEMVKMGNRDGFGLSYVEGERDKNFKIVGNTGRIKVEKSMGVGYEVAKLYSQHMDNNVAFHVRNATHGEKNLENCHPYWVLNKDEGDKLDLVMFHNGTISDVQIDKKYSDSYNFATKILRPLLRRKGHGLLQDPAFQYFLCAMIGRNKLLFMDSYDRVILVNQDLWSQHPTGAWVSTFSEIKVKPPYVPPVVVNRQFGATQPPVTTTGNTDAPIAWRYKAGEWRRDSDGKDHFIPKRKPDEVDNVITADEKAGGTGNGSPKVIDYENIDEEAMKEWEDRAEGWDLRKIEDFVLAEADEAVQLMIYLYNKYDKDADMTPLIALNIVKSDPFMAAKNIYVILNSSQRKVQTFEGLESEVGTD